MYIGIINDLKDKKEITFKQYLRYYKYALKLEEKFFFELLLDSKPIDIDRSNEELYYEIRGILKYKILNTHYLHI